MGKLLTVVITTYNRKQFLLETLRSFESQGLLDKYKIVVSNNCSNYNVSEWLSENLSKEFLDIIEVYNRPFNVGADVNISFSFQLCNTDWMWLMSDDDIAMPSSLKTVLNDIQSTPDIAHIKYSISGFDSLPNIVYNNFEDVLDCFANPKFKSGCGQFVFMSTNVINLKKVHKYIGNAPYYANTCITQLIPSIFAICNDNLGWKLSEKCITTYENRPSSFSHMFLIVVNFTNVSLLNIDFTDKVISKIYKLFKFEFRKGVIDELLKVTSNKKRKLLFYRMWNYYYPFFSLKGWMLYFYFHIMNGIMVFKKNNTKVNQISS